MVRGVTLLTTGWKTTTQTKGRAFGPDPLKHLGGWLKNLGQALVILAPAVYAYPMSLPTTRIVSVTELLRTLESSSDIWSFDGTPEGWMTLINEKAADSGFGRLIDSILEDGWAPGSSIGIRNNYVFQGHHRLVAAILLGLDEVEVSDHGTCAGRALSAHADYNGIYNEFDLYDVAND